MGKEFLTEEREDLELNHGEFDAGLWHEVAAV
jgi:hypothetical protein